MTMTWTQGRRLESLTKDGVTHSYTYDVNGIRTSKTINGVTTSYILADGTLLGVMVPNQYRLIFLRDNNDTIYGFKYYKYVSSTDTYNYNQTYYYETNAQGDVIALYNASGTLTATYKYDAWGKLLGVYNASGTAITSSTSIGIINPIRYRGYIYDTETGFYYLQSRYYDPEVGRFLNLDAYISTGTGFIGYNMYAYCNNNPVNVADPSGTGAGEAAIGWASTMWWLSLCDGPVPVGDIIYVAGIGVTGLIALVCLEDIVYDIDILVDTGSLVTDAGTITRSNTRDKAKSDTTDATKDIAIPQTRQNDRGQTYYHITTKENARLIMASGVLVGSDFEGGYVYAWKLKPSRYACKNSGAHGTVIISFQTNSSFIPDTGIDDPRVKQYCPVVSLRPGPIAIDNVQYVGRVI